MSCVNESKVSSWTISENVMGVILDNFRKRIGHLVNSQEQYLQSTIFEEHIYLKVNSKLSIYD